MAKHALFIQHLAKRGKRDEVQRIWRKHMQPTIEANAAHEGYVYSFESDPDRICAFQVYSSAEDANAFLKEPAYLEYEREVAPLLDGAPKVELLQPQWIKETP